MITNINQNKASEIVIVPMLSHLSEEVKLLITKEFKVELSSFSKLIQSKSGSDYLFQTNGDLIVVFVLLGETTSPKKVKEALRLFVHKHSDLLKSETGLFINSILLGDVNPQFLESSLKGFLLGFYNLGLYKTETDKKVLVDDVRLNLSTNFFNPEKALDRAKAIVSAQANVMDLINAPSNHKNAHTIAQLTQKAAETYGFECKVLDHFDLEKQGFYAILAVNQGSLVPSKMLVLSYGFKNNEWNTEKPLIALAGKGVTFDTGGVSMKQSTNMHFMKSDMGGAAAILGFFQAAAELKLTIQVVAAIPLTDNAVDSKSINPGDVIGSYSGKTIEIIDTDAEGRLVLADALAFLVKNYQPDILIDLATLTGSAVQTLGYSAAAYFTNNESLAEKLYTAGQESTEKTWRLPLWDDYLPDIHSDIADVKNYSGKPVAGAISAAKFLEVFTEKHPAWAHIDMAGVAFGDSSFSKMRAATGYGVELLLAICGDELMS